MEILSLLFDYDVIFIKKLYFASPVQPLLYSERNKSLFFRCNTIFFNVDFTISVNVENGIFSLPSFSFFEQPFQNLLSNKSISLCKVLDIVWFELKEDENRHKIDEIVYVTYLQDKDFLFGFTKNGYFVSLKKKRNVLHLM